MYARDHKTPNIPLSPRQQAQKTLTKVSQTAAGAPGPRAPSVFYAITVSNFLQFLTFVGAGCWPWFVNFFLGVRFLLPLCRLLLMPALSSGVGDAAYPRNEAQH